MPLPPRPRAIKSHLLTSKELEQCPAQLLLSPLSLSANSNFKGQARAPRGCMCNVHTVMMGPARNLRAVMMMILHRMMQDEDDQFAGCAVGRGVARGDSRLGGSEP